MVERFAIDDDMVVVAGDNLFSEPLAEFDKARSASSSVSFDPMSNQRPGIRHAKNGTRVYIHSTRRPGWSGSFPSATYRRTRGNVSRG